MVRSCGTYSASRPPFEGGIFDGIMGSPIGTNYSYMYQCLPSIFAGLDETLTLAPKYSSPSPRPYLVALGPSLRSISLGVTDTYWMCTSVAVKIRYCPQGSKHFFEFCHSKSAKQDKFSMGCLTTLNDLSLIHI